ncbi:CubicO group peptidase (beta-lactamase class C family) [Pedobacter sp. AK013]|uniref:serine hydrolase domain-containing protein n=1 Tax=Pedobacter sp. AK013 TaxID=2723071 RepID=UPI0016162B63|nr:serine hydrolase domain-containing protein [Pedobacter sp. AK013]MBB6236824.1 CubicO group peptidase (beta-lactamase class C family) [Pedobacter sp. AK013]
MKAKFFNFLLLLLVAQPGLFAQNILLQPADPAANGFSADRLNRIDQVIESYVDSNWIKGAVGLVVRNGKIVYYKSFGIDDVNKNTPLQKDAIFRIASQTKAITSTAVMILFEEGKILLDDPISKYIPSFARPKVLDTFNEKDSSYTTLPAKREITIKDLLTHTSGIDYAQIGSPKMQAIYAKAGIQAGFSTHKQLLADAIDKLGTLPLIQNPGERFTYSLSVDVLGRLIEVVSGLSLDVFLQKRIFKPLGMEDTYFNLPANKKSRLVKVYTEDKETNKPVLWKDNTFPGSTIDYPINNNGYFAGGAGLVSTIKDYAIFLQMYLNGGEYNGNRILSRHTVEIVTKNQIGDIPFGDDKFGLGFQITTNKGNAKLGLSEGSFSWGGFFGTSYWADPKEKLSGLLFLQQWPFKHSELSDKFKVLVYQALQ